MKAILRILLFLILAAGMVFLARFVIKQFGPEDWYRRVESRKLSSEKRIKLLKDKLDEILKVHKQHISTINSLVKIYKSLAKANSDKIKNLVVLSNIQNQTANEYKKVVFLQEALKYYNLALEIYKYDTEAIVNKGICYYNIGLYEQDPVKKYKDFVKAENNYKKAIAISKNRNNPTDKQWYKKSLLYLSLLYRVIREKKIDEAASSEGIASARRNFLKLAINAAKELYKIDPEYIQGLFMLGALHYMAREPQRAKHYYMLIIAAGHASTKQRKKAQKYINKINYEINNAGSTR